MVPYKLFLSLVSGISIATTTTPVSALPDQVFWDNNWPSDTTATDKGDDLLKGTVLFAQSQVFPSKHGIQNDEQPRLTAMRKALVMFRPHDFEDESVVVEMTVRDADGTVISGDKPIKMKDPEKIPKQDGWIDLGKVKGPIKFPSQLSGNPYVVEGQSSLDEIVGSEESNDNLANIFNNKNKRVKARTWNGSYYNPQNRSWVTSIYLPQGSEVPVNAKFEISVESSLPVTIHYPKSAGSSKLRTREVSTDENLVFVMVSDVWVAKGDPKPTYVPRFPSSLDSPHIINSQSTLNNIGNDPDSAGLINLMNDNEMTPTDEIEIITRDGSWVRDIYLPDGSLVPENSRVQVTCDSGYSVNVFYPNVQTGGIRRRSMSRGDVLIFMLTSNNDDVWLAENDLEQNEYVFGHNFYTATLKHQYVKPGMTLEFSASSGEKGVLEADVGAVTELTITALDAGFLTEPRNEFTFKDDPILNTEYWQTTEASRLVVVQYETMQFTEIMLPDGKFYDTVSDDTGGVYEGDMRQSIGKILLSHGIDLANYGIPSSLAQSEKPHTDTFTCALLAGHNTVGMYQNGQVVHGLSGGNGMITLSNSEGNEFSHEVGHNYGLGHYPDGFDGSIHRQADKINSSWGWDSRSNTFLPNFSPSNTGKDRCYEDECQSAFLGKYKYGSDSMAGGSPLWGTNRYTMYTPYVSNVIQKFLEGKAMWDPSSSTGFRKYDSTSGQMEEFTNNDNGQKVPQLYRVPVTTIVGYYDPDRSRSLQSYIYPALHGAYGFVYDDDGGSTTGTSNGCELVVETKDNTLVFELGTSIDGKGMTKFHVNVATEDEPSMATIYCQNDLLAERELDGPKTDRPPLTYTVNGVPFAQTDCKDDTNTFKFGPQERDCEWIGRKKKKTQKRCRKKIDGVKVWDICVETCGRVGLGICKDYYD